MIPALILLLSTASYAGPPVGAKAVYDTNIKTGDGTILMSLVNEVVQIDEINKKYLHRVTQQISGQPDQVEDSWEDFESYLSEESVSNVLAHCAEAGGQVQSVSVPAGTFPTCALPVSGDAQGTVWIAHVPFGFVHSHTFSNGTEADLSLRSFQ